jgi:hypothetical protein
MSMINNADRSLGWSRVGAAGASDELVMIRDNAVTAVAGSNDMIASAGNLRRRDALKN